jgi:hypothetical protein
MPTIESVHVAENLTAMWGINAYEYKIEDAANTSRKVQVDFQDLMVAISERRATVVEGEIVPLSTRMRDRNATLDKLGTALSELTAAQATLKSEATGSDSSSYTFTDATKTTVKKLTGNNLDNNETKKWLEYFVQRVKSKIDGLNNDSQTDMTRLQSLVDRRDESYSTATNLMTDISDTRSNLIRNL